MLLVRPTFRSSSVREDGGEAEEGGRRASRADPWLVVAQETLDRGSEFGIT